MRAICLIPTLLLGPVVGRHNVNPILVDLPWKVGVGYPRIWPGMEKGPVGCYEPGGLVDQVLNAYADEGIAETASQAQFYFEEGGVSLDDLDSGSIINLLIPASLGLDFGTRQLSAEGNFTGGMDGRNNLPSIEDLKLRVKAGVDDYTNQLQARGTKVLPMQRAMKGIALSIEEAASYKQRAEQIAPRASEIADMYDQPQLTLVLSKMLGRLVAALAVQVPETTLGVDIRGKRTNFAKSICEAINSMLLDPDESDDEAHRSRCSVQTAFTSMMACGASPIDCSYEAPRDYRLFDHCSKPSTANPEIPVRDITDVPLSLLPREEVDAYYESGEVPAYVVQEEAETYNFAWSAMQAGGQWTQNATCKDNSFMLANTQLLPGWEIVYDMWLRPEGSRSLNAGTSMAYPFALLARNVVDQCKIMLANRGTATEWEWYVDIDAFHEPVVLDGHPHASIKGHRGMANLANTHWPGLRDYVVHEVLPNCSSGVEVFVTGHSLGGGLGIMWAAKFASLLNGLLRPRDDGRPGAVNTVIFSPLRVFEADSLTFLREHLAINLRSVVMSLDLITGLPCSGGIEMELCNTRASIGMNGDGRLPAYGDPWNEISLNPSYMEEVDPASYFYNDTGLAAVRALASTVSLPSTLNAGASHNCAPECFAVAKGCSLVAEERYGCDFETSVAYGTTCTPAAPIWDFVGAKCHIPIPKHHCVF